MKKFIIIQSILRNIRKFVVSRAMKKRFPITDYLEVVLTEDDKTVIYINGEHFIQCSHILTTVHTDEIENLLLLESVDEIEVNPKIIEIDPETRFFVHCSNLQAWVENNFDSRMLHSNLSFPLLKKLVEEGCVNSIILKEELAKRFEHVISEAIDSIIEDLDAYEVEDLDDVHNYPEFLNLLESLSKEGSLSTSTFNLINFLYSELSKEDFSNIITSYMPKNVHPTCLKLFYNWNLIDREWFKQYLTKILEAPYNSFKDLACDLARESLTSKEQLSIIPIQFRAIKDVVKNLEVDFSLYPSYFEYFYDEYQKRTLLFSINDDAIRIGIQHYPDLHRHFIWIITALGNINSSYKIELHLYFNKLLSLRDDLKTALFCANRIELEKCDDFVLTFEDILEVQILNLSYSLFIPQNFTLEIEDFASWGIFYSNNRLKP